VGGPHAPSPRHLIETTPPHPSYRTLRRYLYWLGLDARRDISSKVWSNDQIEKNRETADAQCHGAGTRRRVSCQYQNNRRLARRQSLGARDVQIGSSAQPTSPRSSRQPATHKLKHAPWPASRGCSGPLGPACHWRCQYRGVLFCCATGPGRWDLTAGCGACHRRSAAALTITPGGAAPVAYLAAVAGPLIGADRRISGRSKRAQSERRALAGPEFSMASSFRALSGVLA
jgi:hypothetical protein